MLNKIDIIETLNEWNYWNRELIETFSRESYESEILKKSTTDEIIVLKGVRRSGKSTLLLNVIKQLVRQGVDIKNILFVNFEDPKFINHLDVGLMSIIKDSYLEFVNPDAMPYLVLDEVQNVDGFEKWLLKEYELKKSRLFITGSNSVLLSKEIGSALSGRYLDQIVFPLSFKEFLKFNKLEVSTPLEFIQNRLQINRLFDQYQQYGGFPKVALTHDDILKKAELRAYFDSILMRDIVARYRLDNVSSLMKLAVYLMSNIANQLSVNSIKNHFQLSFDLVNSYIEYLENAFLIFRVPFFDWSLKKQNSNPKKIYSIDQGLSGIVSFQLGQKIGNRLENTVFLELLRNNNEVYYYKTSGNFEVDFVVKKDQKITHLIQVVSTLENDKTQKREIRSLLKASDEIPEATNAMLLILVPDLNDTIQINGKTIFIKDVKSWLLFG